MKTRAFEWGQDLKLVRQAVAPEFDVVRRIGVGSNASVFLARRNRDPHDVALKVMHPGLMNDVRNIARFERESRALARLEHANIVRVYSAELRGGLHCIEMDFLTGGALRERMHARAPHLPLPVILHWLAQLCSALAYAHAHGILHRDLNPANIRLDGNGNAVVTDFGIATIAGEPQLTDQGFTIGTSAYMSPERLTGADASVASDLFAIGVIAYELIAGRRPQHAGEALQQARPDCPARIAHAVMRLLAPRPEDRFTTASEAASEMRARTLQDGDPNLRWARPGLRQDAPDPA